jgi:hypothetical protein
MNFDFESTAGVSQSSTRKPLEGNMIHDVIFDGCEARDFTGTQDSSKQFLVLEIKFHNDDGYFTHTIWEPREEDLKDREGAFGMQPSNFKVMMYTLKHLIDAVNPELGKAIDNKEKNLNTTSWDSLRKLMVQATDPGKGTQTKIKLVKNNKGVATFPFFAAYNKEGKLYMQTNFIGKNIFFTNKELDRIAKATEAKPTDVLSLDAPVTAQPAAPSNDFNFDI